MMFLAFKRLKNGGTSMNVKLYNTTSPKIQVNKTLNLVADIDGEPHDIVSETEMTLRLTVGHLQGVQGSNYCYVADTGKYYFISPNYQIEGHSVIINLKEDVLMSLKTQLLAQTCTITRNENLRNAYLYDEAYQMLAYKKIVTKKFPSGIDNNTIILMTVG